MNKPFKVLIRYYQMKRGVKLYFFILAAVFVEIILLVNSTAANSYLLSKQNSVFDETIIENGKNFSAFDKFGGLVLNFLSISQIGIVSADSGGNGFLCCAKAKDNSTCQEFPAGACDEKCASGCEQTSCLESANCKLGCCFDERRGTCAARSGRQTCSDSGGKWTDEEMCNVQECKLGCCILGTDTAFVTEKKCELLSGFYGFLKDFKSEVQTEFGCYFLKEEKSQAQGACVISLGEKSGKTCKIMGEGECITKTKDVKSFYKGMLCSNPEIKKLEITCIAQHTTGCVDGRDGVYWFDSCGNAENIYDSDKIRSWNNGYLLGIDQSCSLEKDFSNTNRCGNCDRYVSSSSCISYETKYGKKPTYGNFVCKNLECNYKGQIKKNGESWCVYDGYIGEGKDVVGSRHWKYSCVQGEIKVEGCSDYRNGVCAYSPDTKTATCRVNGWRDCMQSTLSDGSCSDKAGEDCETRKIEVGELTFNACTPKYPPGFMQKVTDVEDNSHKETGEAICAQANRKFVVIYQNTRSGWECMYNCGIENSDFTQQMNDYCVSLGDCGGYVNIAGQITNNYEVNGAEDIDLEQYKTFAAPVAGQYVLYVAQDIVAAMMGYAGAEKDKLPEQQKPKAPGYLGLQTGVQVAGGVTGATGMLAGYMATTKIAAGAVLKGGTTIRGVGGLSFSKGPAVTGTFSQGSFSVGEKTITATTNNPVSIATSNGQTIASGGDLAQGTQIVAKGSANVVSETATTASGASGQVGANTMQVTNSFANGMSNAMGSIGAASMAATALSFLFGLKGDAALMMSVAGMAVGLTFVGISYLANGSLAGCLAGWVLAIICLAVLLIIAIVLKSMKVGTVKEVEVSFRCMTWEPPTGGIDCSLCNKDEPLKQCTKYRCESLGQTCSFNKTTNLCRNTGSGDKKEPKITPLAGVLTKGYKYDEQNGSLRIRTSDGKCVPQMNALEWGLSTDNNAQCKMDVNPDVPYDKMGNFFGGKNNYLKNHLNSFYMPSVNLIMKTYGIPFGNGTGEVNLTEMSGEVNLSKFNGLDLYVKCMDQSGNINKKDYIVNFCVAQTMDNSSAEIVVSNPEKESYLKLGESSANITFYLSEPAECKYDYSPKLFSEMNKSLNCKTGVNDWVNEGWPCDGVMQNVTSIIYIKCKDQPGEIESKRNINQNAYEFYLKKTQSPLKIDSITPVAGSIFNTGNEFVTVNLGVKTSGGANNGIARCLYNFDGLGDVWFLKTFANTHEQTFGMLPNGEYNLEIGCRDDAGNFANSTTNFKIIKDDISPAIIRYFNKDGALEIITDELAKCQFSLKNCQFDFSSGDEGSKMDSIYNKIHKGFITEKDLVTGNLSRAIFYIKCQDVLGNKNTDCFKIGAY